MTTRTARLQAQELPAPLASNEIEANLRDEAKFALATAAVNGTDIEVAQAAANVHQVARDIVVNQAQQELIRPASDPLMAEEVAHHEGRADFFRVAEDGSLSPSQATEVAGIRQRTRARIKTVQDGKYDAMTTYGLERGDRYLTFYENLGRQAVEHDS